MLPHSAKNFILLLCRSERIRWERATQRKLGVYQPRLPNCSCLTNIREGHMHRWPTPWTVQQPEDGAKHSKLLVVSLHMVTCAGTQRGKEDRAALGSRANLRICS